MIDQQPTWPGKLPLTDLPGRLCPGLQQLHWRATMIATRAKPVPPGATARLAAKLVVKETARLVTKEGAAINSCPAGAEEFPGEEGAIPPEANVSIGRDAKVMIWYGDSPPGISPERFAEIENIAQEKAQAEAERQVRDFYRRVADRAKQRRHREIVQTIADGEHFHVTGRRGQLLNDHIQAHWATRLQVDLDARTVRLPSDGSDDQDTVWHDVFISCMPIPEMKPNGKGGQDNAKLQPPAPARNRGAATPRDDDAMVATMLAEGSRDDFSVRDFVLSHTEEIEGNSDDAKVRRLQRKYSEARKASPG